MAKLTYSEAVDILYGFINYELKRQDRYSPDVMTIERPAELMAQLGNPHHKYPIIHVTGTKGKGSVGAMCKAILRQAGYKVGLYSSPHLQDFRERFQINNELITESEIASLVEKLLPHFQAVEGLTWFELVTAVAFEYFARQEVDVAVIEVGLGGRLDATNIVTPVVSVITSLSFDHTYLLGNTISEIAMEKGGIIKPNVPIVSAPQPDEAVAMLEQISAERHASLTLIGRDYEFTAHPPNLMGQQITLKHRGAEQDYRTNLIGEHQAINMSVVLAAIHHMQKVLPISEADIQAGLQQVNWPGRLEIVRHSPTIVLDAAHNRASCNYLRKALTTIFNIEPLVLVYGAKGDKDIFGMLDELLPIVQTLIITQAVDSRAESPDSIAEIARETGFEGEILIIPPIQDAIETAQQILGETGLICVTGSLYVVGEARTVLDLPIAQVISPPPPQTSSVSGD